MQLKHAEHHYCPFKFKLIKIYKRACVWKIKQHHQENVSMNETLDIKLKCFRDTHTYIWYHLTFSWILLFMMQHLLLFGALVLQLSDATYEWCHHFTRTVLTRLKAKGRCSVVMSLCICLTFSGIAITAVAVAPLCALNIKTFKSAL